MKISNSKKQLAKIISENGGWRDVAKFSAQDYDGDVFFYKTKPTRFEVVWRHDGVLGGDWINCGKALPNWHQTVLASDEYFHLYPVPDADGWNNLGSSVARDVVAVDGRINTGTFGDGRPTIEQLASEYRNLKDFALRKRQEADAAKTDADAKLAELVAAGKALGLVLDVVEPEPDLVIADWRDLRERDVIWFCGDDEQGEGEYSVLEVEHRDYGGQRAVRIDTIGNDYWVDVSDDWKFIRRP